MKDKLGREIFCPLGVLGRCYVIPTTEKSKEIARFHRWYPMTAVIASAVVMALFGRLFGVGVGALAIGMLFAKYWRWQSSMTVCESEAVPTFTDLHRANERGAGKVRLWLLLASCIAVLAMLVSMMVHGNFSDFLVGTVAIVGPGFGAVIVAWRLVLAYRAPTKDHGTSN